MKEKSTHCRLLLLLGAVFVFSLTSCRQDGPLVSVRLLTPERITAPAGAYTNLLWLAANRLAVDYESALDSSRWTHRVWSLGLDGQSPRPVDLQEDSQSCRRTEFDAAQVVPGSRMVVVRYCLTYGSLPNDNRIWVWDSASGLSTELRNYSLPGGFVKVAFAPDLSQGLMSTDSHIADSLFWLDKDSPRPLDVGLARARRPAWSPDGKYVVFFGNTEMNGQPGPDWAMVPYDLWEMPADCEGLAGGCAKHLQRLTSSIYDETALDWSPDGRWLVFDGDLQGRTGGIWLRRLETGELIEILAGDYRQPHWSPDGKRIAVIGPPQGSTEIDNFDNGSSIFLIDVSNLVGKR